jgi:hypothetical protein
LKAARKAETKHRRKAAEAAAALRKNATKRRKQAAAALESRKKAAKAAKRRQVSAERREKAAKAPKRLRQAENNSKKDKSFVQRKKRKKRVRYNAFRPERFAREVWPECQNDLYRSQAAYWHTRSGSNVTTSAPNLDCAEMCAFVP